jgi:hypothetical protein
LRSVLFKPFNFPACAFEFAGPFIRLFLPIVDFSSLIRNDLAYYQLSTVSLCLFFFRVHLFACLTFNLVWFSYELHFVFMFSFSLILLFLLPAYINRPRIWSLKALFPQLQYVPLLSPPFLM